MKFRLFLALSLGPALSLFAQQTPQQIAEAEAPALLAIYKDIHTHPELSTKEERTSALLAIHSEEILQFSPWPGMENAFPD